MEKTCVVYSYAVEAEVERLTDLAHRHGWAIAKTFTECSSIAPDRRTALATIRRMLGRGEVEALVVPSLVMLGGTLDETVALIAQIATAKADLIVGAEIDTTRPDGQAWMAAITGLQGYKEALRQEKARAGQRRARESGVHCGRPKLPMQTIEKARVLIASGIGTRESARRLGISPARIHAEKRALQAERRDVLGGVEG